MKKYSLKNSKQETGRDGNADTNPVQSNSQHIHVHINEGLHNKNFGEITGTISLKDYKRISYNTKVYLFWGNENKFPVYELRPASNGNFIIKGIPPGFYTLQVISEGTLQYSSKYIRVFPGQTFHKSILI